MALIEGWFPPTRENYELLLILWQIGLPVWCISWYGMGKTSVDSRFNLPGRIGWLTMEAPGFITLLYMMKVMPEQHGIDDLPWQNKVLAGLFVIHYSYRAIMFPFMQPSMSPVHILVWCFALIFQFCNAACIGAYLAAYGPTTEAAWATHSPTLQFVVGIAIFYLGLASNFFHDEELREIRRREQHRHERIARESGGRKSTADIKKVYHIPQAGLFRYMLYPHYFCEWCEWFGFWMAAGWGCAPARAFLVNEIVAMLPRAVKGKKWYVDRFGEDKIGKKWAVIPGVW